MYEYARGEIYDASGKLVFGTPPFLPNMSGGLRGLKLGHVSGHDLDQLGTALSGNAPAEMPAASVAAFVDWARYELTRSIRTANDKLTGAERSEWRTCLDLSVAAGKTTLAPGGEHYADGEAVAPHHGPGFASATLTGSTGAGTPTPAGATTTGAPVQATFTAPTSGWKGTTALFGAKSKQGKGAARSRSPRPRPATTFWSSRTRRRPTTRTRSTASPSSARAPTTRPTT